MQRAETTQKEIIKVSDIQIGDRFRKDQGDIQSLAESIRSTGLLHLPVIGPNNELIAGYRRIEALKLLGNQEIEVRRIKVDDAIQAQIDENKIRKDFTPSEWVSIGEYLEPKLKLEAESRKLATLKKGDKLPDVQNLHIGTNIDERKTRAQVAKYLGISGPTYEKAKKVVKAAQDDQELVPLVSQMDKTGKVSEAFTVVRKAARKKEVLANKEINQNNQNAIQLFLGDFRQSKEIVSNTVDMIFTDPPYSQEALPLFSDLGRFAKNMLKEGGILATFTGTAYLNQTIYQLSEYLSYYWLITVRHTGETAKMWPWKIKQRYKAILLFSKGIPRKHEWIFDYLEGEKGEKEIHEWAQGLSEAKYLIDAFSDPGQLIVDPMSGSGTTLLAASELGRKAIGYELDKQAYELSRRYLKI